MRQRARPDPWEPREGNLPGPPGGEEFAIVLDGTDRAGARLLAERIRKEVAAQVFSSGVRGRVNGDDAAVLNLDNAVFNRVGIDGKNPASLIAATLGRHESRSRRNNSRFEL